MRLSFTHEADFRQERDFGQKISATFEFIGAHWRPLGRVLLYLVLPAALMQSILSALVQWQVHESVQAAAQGQGAGLGGALQLQLQQAMWGALFNSPGYWLNGVVGIVFITLLVLSIYGYVLVLLHRRTPGPAVTVAEVWTVVRREFISTFFSVWGVFMVITLGFFFLVVPGLYLSVALSLFFVVKLTEGTGFGATLSRCLRLTRGKWWSTFGLLLIMVLILYVVLLGVGFAATLLSGDLAAMVHSSQEQSPLFTVVLTTLNSLLLLLLYPPLLLVLAFQYFNLVERKDGVGLRRLVERLGQTAPPQTSSASYRPDEEGEY